MLNLSFDPQKLATVLCLGAHCDDIEIGCGGTLMTLAARYPPYRERPPAGALVVITVERWSGWSAH